MIKITRTALISLLIAVLFCASASADFTVKTKMTMSGIPMMGNISIDQSYFIKDGAIATIMKMNNPMMAQMGQAADQETRTIVRKGGSEVLIINMAEKTYTKLSGADVDSAMKMIENLGGMLDSLKEMMEFKKMDLKMTGNTKEIGGMKAEEMTMDMEMMMQAPMGGSKPVPIDFKITGSQWGTKDFPEYASYKSMSEKMMAMMMGSGQSGLSGFAKLAEILGLSEDKMDVALKFAQLLPVGGNMTMNMDMSAAGGEGGQQMPGMNFNIQMNTELIEASKDKISDAFFEVPEGFKEEKFDIGAGGGFNIPGMGQF